METLYMSLRDATNNMFFFSQKPIYNQSTIGEKRLFLREQKQTACVHRRTLRFCTAVQNEQPLCSNFVIARSAATKQSSFRGSFNSPMCHCRA
ncbi:MAG: hypothetical protein II973_04315 [Spirochaetaceae bacterium]|nr:hypothetical protein [Spirochaetaceae bacterium]